MSDFNVMRRKKVSAIYVRPGEDALAFVTPDGTFAFETEGDCCSETWFADINNPQALLSGGFGYIYKIEDFELPDPEDGRSRQESDQVMGVRLTTHAGVCEILYRNSSNGHYGGSISRVFVPESIEGWVAVTEDWRA